MFLFCQGRYFWMIRRWAAVEYLKLLPSTPPPSGLKSNFRLYIHASIRTYSDDGIIINSCAAYFTVVAARTRCRRRRTGALRARLGVTRQNAVTTVGRRKKKRKKKEKRNTTIIQCRAHDRGRTKEWWTDGWDDATRGPGPGRVGETIRRPVFSLHYTILARTLA